MSLVGFKAKNHPQQVGKNGVDDDTDDRGTKREFIDELELRFGGFTLDVAAAPHNAKAPKFYTREDDGLVQPWRGNVWCNPPYSDLSAWVFKAWAEWEEYSGYAGLERIVMLLPSNRPEQKWWQEHVEPYRDQPDTDLRVEFLPGRMRFDRPGVAIGPKGDRPPFGCCLLIWERA
jgi:phage N-6-adenine-methyltransferase